MGPMNKCHQNATALSYYSTSLDHTIYTTLACEWHWASGLIHQLFFKLLIENHHNQNTIQKYYNNMIIKRRFDVICH